MAKMFNQDKEEGMPMSADTVIGKSVKLDGTFNGTGDVAVYGEVVGTLTTEGDLMVEEGARIEADVTAHNITVSGEIKGTVQASSQLRLLSTGKIYGDVVSDVFSVETGAVLQGKCATGNSGSVAPTTTGDEIITEDA